MFALGACNLAVLLLITQSKYSHHQTGTGFLQVDLSVRADKRDLSSVLLWWDGDASAD